jgi:hypothetical protein
MCAYLQGGKNDPSRRKFRLLPLEFSHPARAVPVASALWQELIKRIWGVDPLLAHARLMNGEKEAAAWRGAPHDDRAGIHSAEGYDYPRVGNRGARFFQPLESWLVILTRREGCHSFRHFL